MKSFVPSTATIWAVVLLWLTTLAGAQNLTVPTEKWLNSTSDLPRSQREILASNAAQQLTPHVNPSGCLPGLDVSQSTTFYAVLALQDYYSGNKSYANTVTSNMQNCIHSLDSYANFTGASNEDAIYWALALFYAYRTYGLEPLLDSAKDGYDIVSQSLITPAAAQANQGAGRNVSFFGSKSGDCPGPLAGGVFQVEGPSDLTVISSAAVGPFFMLSAYLFQTSGDEMYKTNAQLSLDFMTARLWENIGPAEPTWDPTICTTNAPHVTTSDSAWYIEGLSVWANMTQNSTLTTMLESAVTVVANYSQWTLINGILGEPAPLFPQLPPDETSFSTHKSILARALTVAWHLNPGTPLAAYIEAFITVQFNSLLTTSKAPNADLYTTSWFGAQNNGTLDLPGNLVAIDLLNAAFSFAPVQLATNSTGSGSGTNSTGSEDADSKSGTHVGAIAGGVAGGSVALLAASVIFFFYCVRRRRRSRSDAILDEPFDSRPMEAHYTSVEPFVAISSDGRVAVSKNDRHSGVTVQRGNSIVLGDLPPGAAMPVRTPRSADFGQNTSGLGDNDDDGVDVPTIMDAMNRLNQRLHRLLRTDHTSEPPPEYEL